MIYKSHLIELWVNDEKVELEDQKSININLNNVLYDPTKISNKQAEYSFEFEIPCTNKNNKIFDYVNTLSKPNKFHNRYSAVVYADGEIIFNGTITISSIKNNMYKVNLVSVKIYSLEDIFGDEKLTDIPWYVPFSGVTSINEYNADSTSKVVFPLVSYGAFQKAPIYGDEAGSDYTSKYDIDSYNRWYLQSFPPSINMMEAIKKAFEGKGKTVIGDAFSDAYLKEIFMSTNLADEQAPDYNWGNPILGHFRLSTSWSAPQDDTSSLLPITYGLSQDLKFPYLKSGNEYLDCVQQGDCVWTDPDYNFDAVRIYDMLLASEGGTVTIGVDKSYLYRPNEHLIVIPADGFYKIDMDVSAQLNQVNDLTAKQWVHERFSDTEIMTSSVTEKDITFHPDFKITTPLEIQLVKNYNQTDGGIELIKGKNNFRCNDGYPDNTTELNFGRVSNYMNWTTCYPHEKMGLQFKYPAPTKWEDLASNQYVIVESDASIGYVPKNGDLMCYDPAVNDNFICGITSMGNKNGGGCAAVIKNGYSWSKMYSERHDALYAQEGYQVGNYTASYDENWSSSVRNKNTYPQSPQNTFSQNGNRLTAHISCLVHLNKNDYLQLLALNRDYSTISGTPVSYATSANVTIDITAASPQTIDRLIAKGFGYNSESEFDHDLKVTNFLNKETKISEWIQDLLDAYNLQLMQDGDVISINTSKKNNPIVTAVDIDDRTNTYDAESSIIDYPRSMAVQYKIDTDEHGFYITVPEDKLALDDWKNYGDSGFTVIYLNDDTYETKDSKKSLKFSYTWYDNFYLKPSDSNFQDLSADTITLRMPVIAKEEYMIDGYDYTESMKHDGYGLSQRFWFRPTAVSGATVWTRTYPAESVNIYTTSNQYNTLNLSYKIDENSILKKYFNIEANLASNYVTVNVYLNPEEYKRLKDGAYVKFDEDLYRVVEIQAYNPTCYSTTELKMMKI